MLIRLTIVFLIFTTNIYAQSKYATYNVLIESHSVSNQILFSDPDTIRKDITISIDREFIRIQNLLEDGRPIEMKIGSSVTSETGVVYNCEFERQSFVVLHSKDMSLISFIGDSDCWTLEKENVDEQINKMK